MGTDASSGATPAAAAPSSLDIVSINSKTVVKAFDLPVVSDTYNSLVKLTSPLSPIVEKIGSMTSPAVDQVLGLKAGIEAKFLMLSRQALTALWLRSRPQQYL